MSKRLQVLMDDDELAKIQGSAMHEGLTVADWVRRALRRALQQHPERTRDRKIAAVRAALEHRFPAPDIEQMLQEIEVGRDPTLP
jgi:hypothetical protein